MENQLINAEIISSLIIKGDISGLTSLQRVQYITSLCQRIGLDPLTQPFKILKLQGREVLYADKGCAQQLCKIYKISTEVTKREKVEDVYVVTVRATGPDGRFTDEDGIVTIGSSKGDFLANAMMKAITKGKRRAVLAYVGLGMLDETEVETIKGAVTVEPPKHPYLHDTPQELHADKELPPELKEVMDLAKTAFKGSKINFLAWLGLNYGSSEPDMLSKEKLGKVKIDLENAILLMETEEKK